MATKSMTVPGIGTVQLYKRRGVRSIKLSIGHDGSVRVSLPYWLPYAAGAEFARKQSSWIASKQTDTTPMSHGSKIGKAHRLVFVPEQGRATLATRITSSGEIRIFYPSTMDQRDPAVQNAAQRACIRALKQQADKLLPTRLKQLASQHDFYYRNVTVKQLKSRWGSCSSEKDIALNCFLMQLPWHLIDYVLMHELLHTRIMAHGPFFWSELEKYVSNLSVIRKEMREHKPVLLQLAP